LLVGPNTLFNSNENDFVIVFEFEKSVENSIEFYLLEHKRSENSAPHQWLREKIIKHSF